jgi:hypothetical protein
MKDSFRVSALIGTAPALRGGAMLIGTAPALRNGAMKRACVLVVLIAAACGGDDDSDQNTAGSPSTGAGTGGVGTSGASATSGNGGTSGGGSGMGGRAGTGGMSTMDAGMRCGNMTCADGERCVDDECVAPMCGGDPGDPVNPGDWDAGVDDDAGAGDGREFEDNGCPPNESCEFDGDDPVCRCGSGAGCPADQACNEDGECVCGDSETCDSDESCCGDTCVDLQNDENNCGHCGRECREGHVCRDGACGCAEAGERLCDDTCVDLDTDENNCGECGEECPSGATCDDGECVCDDEDEIACNGRCVAGNTNQNCGECGERCESPSRCQDPNGALPLGCYCPNFNDVPCDGACISLGTTQNCGACGDSCEGPANVCRDGSCQCPTAGQTACGDRCVNLNTGVDSDPSDAILITDCGACGVTCMAGAACTNGRCACPGGSSIDMWCDEHPVTGATDGRYACIDVNTTHNCGGCGNACLETATCVGTNGSDAPGDFSCDCPGNATHCPGEGCRSLSSDEENCGTCGNVCADAATCSNGTCDCPGGSNVRSCMDDDEDEPICVDTNTDEDHCGSCGNECANGEECCNGDCVDPDSDFEDDRMNCGACGRRCADTGCGFLDLLQCECVNGACQT